MIHLKNYKSYNDELILEKINFNSLIDKFKSSTNKESVKNLIIASLLSVLTVTQVVGVINNRVDLSSFEKSELISALEIKNKEEEFKVSEIKPEVSQGIDVVAKKGDNIYDLLIKHGYDYSVSVLNDFISLNKVNLGKNNTLKIGVKYKLPKDKEIKVKTSDLKGYKNPADIKLSKDGWKHIRDFEKLRLKAYKIGDGMITIGYGHAKPIKKSKYKVGDIISLETANKLFNKDVNNAAAGVRRMFREWKREGYHIKINQNQYDVLVSMAFNMGVEGLKESNFVKKLKENKHNDAGELIKTTSISKKFPGLAVRRKSESEKFNS